MLSGEKITRMLPSNDHSAAECFELSLLASRQVPRSHNALYTTTLNDKKAFIAWHTFFRNWVARGFQSIFCGMNFDIITRRSIYRLRLYWLLFWCSECSLIAHWMLWVLSDCPLTVLIALRLLSDLERWRLTALDKLKLDGRTHERTNERYDDTHIIYWH